MKTRILTDLPQAEVKGTGEWQHKSVELPESADLGVHSTGGWELVSVVRAARPDYVLAYFKRRLI